MHHIEFEHFADGAFKRKKKIGEGGHGAVFIVECCQHEYAMKEYAMKEVPVPVNTNGSPRPYRLWEEAEIMDCFDDRNIAKCVCAMMTDDLSQFRIFMDIARYGDLHSFVEKRGYLHPKTARHFLNQIVSGLRVIHDAGYAHRDIKPHNVLVFGLRDVRIADFGIAKKMRRNDTVTTCEGTPLFRPPEANLFFGRAVDGVAWDIWSAAVVYTYCLLGKYPWDEARMVDPEYDAFQRGDFRSLVQVDRRWMRAKMDFWYLRQLLRHDPLERKYPFYY